MVMMRNNYDNDEIIYFTNGNMVLRIIVENFKINCLV